MNMNLRYGLGKEGGVNHMAEDKDRVKEGEEYRQNIIDKLNVKSSEAKTYKGPDKKKEEKCMDRVKEAKEKTQEKLDSQ